MNNINNKIAINKAIDWIKKLVIDEPSYGPNASPLESLNYAYEDNSAGWELSELCIAFIDFYNELSNENKLLCNKLLNKRCGIDVKDILAIAKSRRNDKSFMYYNYDNDPERLNKDVLNNIEWWKNNFYESVKTESTNKYVKAFREAVEKLQEDDGNPSVTQVIDYDMDNEEVDYWNSGLKEINDTLTKAKHDLEDITWNKYKHNKKLNKALDKLEDLIYYLFNEFAYKSPTNNEYVGSGFVDGLSSDDYTTWDIANVDHAHYK